MGEEEIEDEQPPDHIEPLHHILTHDLNNQLSIIKGYTDLALDAVDDPEIVDHLETIKRQTIGAEAIISTVEDQPRGASQGELEPVDVAAVLSREVDRLQSAYPEADISVDIAGPVQAAGGELLYSVFGNILENALQHAESATPEISIAATVADDAVVVTVDDDGPGLPDDVRDQLVGHDLAHPTTGTHIVRSLVDRYDGEIAVDTGEAGTTITVRLPRADG